MALLTLLTISLMVAIASAGSPWPDNGNPFPGFTNPMMMLRFAPTPAPRVPKFPFLVFNQFPLFPTMAPIQFPPIPPIPSPDDIANMSPPNGGTFNGVVVSSQSSSHRNEDGTVSKNGGATMLFNNDGKVIMATSGDSPPEIFTKTVPDQNTTTQFDFEELKIKPSKLHKFPKSPFDKPFDGFDHHFPTFKPISRKKIETYVPKEGETFTGHSVSTHTFKSEVNGVKKEGASIKKVENDNGLINKEILAYKKGDKPK